MINLFYSIHKQFIYYTSNIRLIFALLLQIGLFNQINLENCPGLTTLLTDGEGIEDLMKLSPEAILLRWVNHHLERAAVSRYKSHYFGYTTFK